MSVNHDKEIMWSVSSCENTTSGHRREPGNYYRGRKEWIITALPLSTKKAGGLSQSTSSIKSSAELERLRSFKLP